MRRDARSRSPLDGWHLECAQVAVPVFCEDRPEIDVGEAAAVPDPGTSWLPLDIADGEAVMGGGVSTMSVKVTNFGSGSALGVALSHGVVDASGFYAAIGCWSDLHSELRGEPAAARPPLVTDRSCIRRLLAAPSLPSPPAEDAALDLCGWRGGALWWLVRKLGRARLRERPRRARLSFSREELATLRRRCASGEGLPSTHEALVASVGREAARWLPQPTSSEPSTCQVHVAVDMRRRAGLPAEFTGNAVHTLSAALGAPHHSPVARACAAVQALTRRVREEPATVTEGWVAWLRQLQRGRLPTDAPRHAIYTNYQARLPVLAPTFGGPCLRAVPGAGDAVHVVPGGDGGVDVLLSLPHVPPGTDWPAFARAVACAD
jgi:hypothetical protein